MRRHISLASALFLSASLLPALATIFATVHGVVHDPQHRPISGAEITLQAADSAFTLRTQTGPEGTFELPQAPSAITVSPRRLRLRHRLPVAHRSLRHQPRRAHSPPDSPQPSRAFKGPASPSPHPIPQLPPLSSPAEDIGDTSGAGTAPSAWKSSRTTASRACMTHACEACRESCRRRGRSR